jgi:hypothetical protein
MEDNHPARRIDLFIPAFLVLAAFLGFGIYLLLSRRANPPASTPPPPVKNGIVKKITGTPTGPVRGIMALKRTDEAAASSLSTTFDVIITADSKGQKITGYDAVLAYDPDYLEFVKQTNPLSGAYRDTVTEANGKIRVSSFLIKPETLPVAFDGNAVMTLSFKALKPGRTELGLEHQKNTKSESNLITENQEDILDKAASLPLHIGDAIDLAEGQTKQISGTGYRIRLVKAAPASPDCRDCIETAQLVIVDPEGKETEVAFRSGGFAGTLMTEVRAKGFLITLNELKNKQVRIFVVPE